LNICTILLATDQSNEINLFWWYNDPYGNTTRMSNDPQLTKKMKTTIPVTIAPAKTSLEKINRKVKLKYRNRLSVQILQKYCVKKLEVIPKGEEKAYKF